MAADLRTTTNGHERPGTTNHERTIIDDICMDKRLNGCRAANTTNGQERPGTTNHEQMTCIYDSRLHL